VVASVVFLAVGSVGWEVAITTPMVVVEVATSRRAAKAPPSVMRVRKAHRGQAIRAEFLSQVA
jgi:hypothetical protein